MMRILVCFSENICKQRVTMQTFNLTVKPALKHLAATNMTCVYST